jgi:protein-serine/threonine kinase
VGASVPAPVKGVLRIHHGAVDQTTITTQAPPEVMKHVREVLEGMGVAIELESEYKYRCTRVKRRKTPSFGLGFREPASNGGSLAAITMVGSAASNGVRGILVHEMTSTLLTSLVRLIGADSLSHPRHSTALEEC